MVMVGGWGWLGYKDFDIILNLVSSLAFPNKRGDSRIAWSTSYIPFARGFVLIGVLLASLCPNWGIRATARSRFL